MLIIDSSNFTKVTSRKQKDLLNTSMVESILGPVGPQGAAGGVGVQGSVGEVGLAPQHEIKGNLLRFKNPDGTWGKWLDLGSKYFPGAAPINYVKVENTPFNIGINLIQGFNIFGVTLSGNISILLPRKVEEKQIIIIKDERGTAATDNITIGVQ